MCPQPVCPKVGIAGTPALQYVTSDTGIAFDRHFDQEGHNFDHHARFILIEQIRADQRQPKTEIRWILEEREDFWIQCLKTLTPYGLNDRYNSTRKGRIHAICT